MNYKEILERSLARLLNLYNLDPLSSKFGYGDRQYSSWKTIDFANGTFQGGVHSIAAAYKLGLLSNKQEVFKIIDSAIKAVSDIRHKNGSMVEAYPNEHSFCVTALVAFDILSCIDILTNELSKEQVDDYLSHLRPLIKFISNNDETHAIISNHLATGVAAIALWNDISGDNNQRYNELVQIIYDNQSQEGWYKEYEGADPGYQTLCTYYLAAAWNKLKDEKLLDSIKASLAFLKYFVHPDGSIGGLYGSRNTEVFYPGGLMLLSQSVADAADIVTGLTKGLEKSVHITPDMIDSWNFIPLINAYAMAALYESEKSSQSIEALPYQTNFEKDFHEAGIYVKSTAKYYCIINYKKGGTCKVFNKENATLDIEDGGIAGILSNGIRFSSQPFDQEAKFDNNQVRSNFYKVNNDYPGPFKFAVLRILALTIFRSTKLGNMFKAAVVKMLMTGKNKIAGGNTRSFDFADDMIIVKDLIKKPTTDCTLLAPGKFKAIHMASSGYNSISNFERTKSASLVKMSREEK